MKLVIVSNRLPMSLHEKQGHWEFTESPGGLASGLRAYLRSAEARELDYVWVGWPGTEVAVEFQAEVTNRCREEFSARPVFLSRAETEAYYEGFCNNTLWPLFHYFLSKVDYDESFWLATSASTEPFVTRPRRSPRPGTWSGYMTTSSSFCRRCSSKSSRASGLAFGLPGFFHHSCYCYSLPRVAAGIRCNASSRSGGSGDRFSFDIDVAYSGKPGANRLFQAIDRFRDFSGGERSAELNIQSQQYRIRSQVHGQWARGLFNGRIRLHEFTNLGQSRATNTFADQQPSGFIGH